MQQWRPNPTPPAPTCGPTDNCQNRSWRHRGCAFKDEASLEADFKASLEAGLEAGFQGLKDIFTIKQALRLYQIQATKRNPCRQKSRVSSPKRMPKRHSAAKDFGVWRQTCIIDPQNKIQKNSSARDRLTVCFLVGHPCLDNVDFFLVLSFDFPMRDCTGLCTIRSMAQTLCYDLARAEKAKDGKNSANRPGGWHTCQFLSAADMSATCVLVTVTLSTSCLLLHLCQTAAFDSFMNFTLPISQSEPGLELYIEILLWPQTYR